MDTEFHYWLTGLIAKRAGFTDDEAQTIAYASEYVDRNDVGHTIRFRDSDREPYQHFISQTMNILKAQTKLMRIYPIFHFVPGDPLAKSAQRRDGKMHLLNTTPNSGHANEMIDEAFKAGDDTALYRIGIASHMYVDTWAHQNFVGGLMRSIIWKETSNPISAMPMPNIIRIGYRTSGPITGWLNRILIIVPDFYRRPKLSLKNMVIIRMSKPKVGTRLNGVLWNVT